MKTHNCALSNTCNSKSNYYIWYIWHLFQSLEPFISVISNDYGSIMAASSWERDAIQPGAFWETSPPDSGGQCNLKCHARWRTFYRNPNFLANHSGFYKFYYIMIVLVFLWGIWWVMRVQTLPRSWDSLILMRTGRAIYSVYKYIGKYM